MAQCSAATPRQGCHASHSRLRFSVGPRAVRCRCSIARRRSPVLGSACRRGAIIPARRRLRRRRCSWGPRSRRTNARPQRRRRAAGPLQDGVLPQHVAQQLHRRHECVLLAPHLQRRGAAQGGRPLVNDRLGAGKGVLWPCGHPNRQTTSLPCIAAARCNALAAATAARTSTMTSLSRAQGGSSRRICKLTPGLSAMMAPMLRGASRQGGSSLTAVAGVRAQARLCQVSGH